MLRGKDDYMISFAAVTDIFIIMIISIAVFIYNKSHISFININIISNDARIKTVPVKWKN